MGKKSLENGSAPTEAELLALSEKREGDKVLRKVTARRKSILALVGKMPREVLREQMSDVQVELDKERGGLSAHYKDLFDQAIHLGFHHIDLGSPVQVSDGPSDIAGGAESSKNGHQSGVADDSDAETSEPLSQIPGRDVRIDS